MAKGTVTSFLNKERAQAHDRFRLFLAAFRMGRNGEAYSYFLLRRAAVGACSFRYDFGPGGEGGGYFCKKDRNRLFPGALTIKEVLCN